MSPAPRLAVGALHSRTDVRPVIWGLLDYLDRFGVSVQPFFYQARLDAVPFAEPIRGLPYRHLDSWLMSPALCRQQLSAGCKGHDWALVEGHFAEDPSAIGGTNEGGRLETLCQWLGLGSVGVLDVESAPALEKLSFPKDLQGVILTNVADPAQARNIDAELRRSRRTPVLGWLPQVPALMGMIDQLPRTRKPSRQLCREFGARLGETIDVLRLFEAADSTLNGPLMPILGRDSSKGLDAGALDVRSLGDLRSTRIAFAMDEAFDRHFVGTWELLREAGVQVTDFSPLRSEAIPPRTSLVVFGDGDIAQFAERLSSNHCFKQSLRQFVVGGGSVFAQGAGTAWLCRELVVDGKRKASMGGILPMIAKTSSARRMPSAKPTAVSWMSIGDSAPSMPRGASNYQGYDDGLWAFEELPAPPKDALGSLALASLSDSHYGKSANSLPLGRVFASPVPLNWTCHPSLLHLAAGVRAGTL